MIDINEDDLRERLEDANVIIEGLLEAINYYVYDNTKIKYICEDLRLIGNNTYWESNIFETIKSLSNQAYICKYCGGEYVYKYDELDNMGYYICKECGKPENKEE